MSRDNGLFLDDILKSCEKILRYIEEISFADFVVDDKTYDPVPRNLEAIGEAGKNLPDDFRDHHPHIEWRKIAGLRDIVAHVFFGVNDEIVWDVVQNKIPVLHEQIAGISES